MFILSFSCLVDSQSILEWCQFQVNLNIWRNSEVVAFSVQSSCFNWYRFDSNGSQISTETQFNYISERKWLTCFKTFCYLNVCLRRCYFVGNIAIIKLCIVFFSIKIWWAVRWEKLYSNFTVISDHLYPYPHLLMIGNDRESVVQPPSYLSSNHRVISLVCRKGMRLATFLTHNTSIRPPGASFGKNISWHV